MNFKLNKWVSYITENSIKLISESFGRRLESKGITRIQWIALYYLGLDSNISQKDLALKMSVKDSSIARLLDRMERDNLVRREKSIEDRRITNVFLTDKGKDMREELLPEGEKFSNLLLNGISEEELQIFDDVLCKMVKNVLEGPKE